MLIAKYAYPDSGYPHDQEYSKKHLVLNAEYRVTSVDMGQSNTSIKLSNIPGVFNSVQFEFYEDGKPINIFKDPRYNPYLKLRRGDRKE
ncbi:MAG: hypothetical protein E7554_09910 [Ruminococcaceae bacterium]|nr:hypothetical protein [Oscillospiraceae bacterium]